MLERFISRVILIKTFFLSQTKSTKRSYLNTFINIEIFSKPDDTAVYIAITCYTVILGKKERIQNVIQFVVCNIIIFFFLQKCSHLSLKIIMVIWLLLLLRPRRYLIMESFFRPYYLKFDLNIVKSTNISKEKNKSL